MEFGKVNPNELENTDFALPPDHADTKSVLKKNKNKPNIYIGCAKWGRPDWVGKIYPKGTKAADFLKLYAQQFNSIELNSTFYQTPTPTVIDNWYNYTPAGFLFVPKFPDSITHLKRLKDTGAALDSFLMALSGLKEKLGPMFLMPHPQMGLKALDTITQFMKDMPADQPLFAELRHADWSVPENADRIFDAMREAGVGSIITDTAGRRDMVHMRLSIPSAFIRFVGNSLHATDYTRIDDWVLRIKTWLDMGLENLYFFMHQHDELYSPELIKYFIDELNKACNLDLKAPVLLNGGKLL